MNIVRYVLAKLPENWQKRLTIYLVSSGKIFTTPIWKMLFQTLSFYGGDEQKIKKTLMRKHDGVESVIQELCSLGEKTKEEADLLSSKHEHSQSEVVRDMYLEAALYYFMGYFFIYEQTKSREIFNSATPIFDKFRKMMEPPVEKWEFEFNKGKFYAHVYYPNGEGPFPAILAYPGNEGIKEHMATYAKHALARSMVLISIDPPGWGESGLSGCKFSSIQDYRLCTDTILNSVKEDPRIDEGRLASFGVSGGSLTSLIVAGFCDYIKAAAGIGAPEYKKQATVWKNALGEQKRKTYTWTGLSNEKDTIKFLEEYARDTEKVLPQIKCSVLLIHGEKDFVTKAESGKEITELIGENASSRIIPNDDHLCSNSIGTGLADEIFNWFAEKLGYED